MIDYVLLEKYTQNLNVLFVEDDESIRKETYELLIDIFPHVDIAVDGKEGFEKYLEFYAKNSSYYDLVITDIRMPNLDGIELTKAIYKQHDEQTVVVLSAHSESEYLMELVNIGIAQFIPKPIELDNFVHVIFNISQQLYLKSDLNEEEESSVIYLSTKLTWDKERQKLSKDDAHIKLTKKELLLIELLLKIPEKTYTVDEIMIHLWKDDENTAPDIKNLKNIISRLRKKIPELDLENVYGFGYKLNIH